MWKRFGCCSSCSMDKGDREAEKPIVAYSVCDNTLNYVCTLV